MVKSFWASADLPPTFLRLAGVPIPDDYSGYDLSSFLSGDEDPPSQFTYSGLGSWRAVTDGRYKLIIGLDETVPQVEIQFGRFDRGLSEPGKLFDLKNDPHELTNLWAKEEFVRESLLALITRG